MTPSTCPNCQAPVRDADARFCVRCGQELDVRPPTLMELLQQFGGAYLSTEGALWRTLWLLVRRPGELTREYFAGRRKHYVLPLRLYLTVSVLVLTALSFKAPNEDWLVLDDGPRPAAGAASGTASSARPAAASAASPRASGDRMNLEFGFATVHVDGSAVRCDGLPAWACDRFAQRLGRSPDERARFGQTLGQRFFSHLGTGMFVLLPLYAALMMLAYAGSGRRYTEHLVFALHVHAFWFLMVGVSLVGWKPASDVASLAIPAYTFMAMGRTYGDRRWPRLARSVFVASAYSAAMVLVMSLLALWAALA